MAHWLGARLVNVPLRDKGVGSRALAALSLAVRN